MKIPIDDSPVDAESIIGPFSYHWEQGLKESDAFGDVEGGCRFEMLEIVNAMQTGEEAAKIVQRLEVGMV